MAKLLLFYQDSLIRILSQILHLGCVTVKSLHFGNDIDHIQRGQIYNLVNLAPCYC